MLAAALLNGKTSLASRRQLPHSVPGPVPSTRKGLINEPFVLNLWIMPEVHQKAVSFLPVNLETSTDNSIAMFLEYDFPGHQFRAFRVFRSYLPGSGVNLSGHLPQLPRQTAVPRCRLPFPAFSCFSRGVCARPRSAPPPFRGGLPRMRRGRRRNPLHRW